MEPDAKLAEALDKCLAGIKEGKSVDVCLAINAEMHDRIKPLLYTGHYIASLPKVEPSEDFRRTAKGRLMARLHEEEVLSKNKGESRALASFPGEVSTTMQNIWQTIAGVRKVALPAALCLLLIVAVTVGAFSFISPPPAMANACTLSVISGTVEVQVSASNVQAGIDGMTLDVGTHVKTSQDSTALLTFFDGSTLKMEPGTDIEIQQLEFSDKQSVTIVLKQWIGRTWSSVVKMADKGSRYEINTPSAVALVRGTRFVVEVNEAGQTIEQTTQGLVSVIAQGEEVFVPAGQATTVEPGTVPSEPEDAPPPVEETQEQTGQQTGDNQPNLNTPPAYGQNNNSVDNSQNNGNSDQKQSNGNGNGQGDDNENNGQGKGNDQDNSNNGEGNGNANGNDDAVNGSGNSNADNGNGNANNGQGSADNGQGNSNSNANNGNGNENNGQGQGNGNANNGQGQGNGNANSGQGNSSNDNGQGNGNSNANNGNGNAKVKDK